VIIGYDLSAGARLSATQKEMPRSRSSELIDDLQSEDRYIQVIDCASSDIK